MFCHSCGLFGNDLRYYVSHFEKKKRGVELDFQYRDWLRANLGLPRFPSKLDVPKNAEDKHREGFFSTNTMEDGIF